MRICVSAEHFGLRYLSNVDKMCFLEYEVIQLVWYKICLEGFVLKMV